MSIIALIDYGAGNLRSVHNALVAAGADNVAVTADPDVVSKADRIVLPGVGAFAACGGIADRQNHCFDDACHKGLTEV